MRVFWGKSLLVLLLCCTLLQVFRVKAQEGMTISTQPRLETLEDSSAILRYIKFGKELHAQNNDSAIGILQAALQNSMRLAFPRGIKSALTALANVYISQEGYEDAVLLYQAVIDYCQERQAMHRAIPALYNNLANVFIKQGDYESAMENYKQAVLYMEKYGTDISGEIFNNLGGLLIQMRKYDQVLYYLDKAEQASQEEDDAIGLINIYGNKGSYFFETGAWDTSIMYTKRALALAKEAGTAQSQFLVLVNLGETYRRADKPAEALTYLLEAQAMDGNIFPVYRNHLLNILGSTYLDLEHYSTSEAYFLKALNDARSAGLKKHIKSAYEGLSRLYEATGKYPQSLENYKAFRQMEDSIEQEGLNQSIAAWDLKFRTAEKDKKIIQSQLQISEQQSKLRQQNLWIVGISAGALLLIALLVIPHFSQAKIISRANGRTSVPK